MLLNMSERLIRSHHTQVILATSFSMPCVYRLSQMHAGHEANVKRYKQIKEDLAVSESTIQEMEDSSNDKADQYKFLQEMRGYVRDLLECFSEKVRENLCSVRFAAFCFVPLWSFTTYIYILQSAPNQIQLLEEKKKKT